MNKEVFKSTLLKGILFFIIFMGWNIYSTDKKFIELLASVSISTILYVIVMYFLELKLKPTKEQTHDNDS